MPQQVSPESNFAQFLIELQAGPGVEDEIAGGVVELVAEHAMVIAELVEIWPKCGAIRSRANASIRALGSWFSSARCARPSRRPLAQAPSCRSRTRHEGGKHGERAKQHQC